MQKQLSSLQNPLVKQILALQEKSRIRKKLGLFVVEGQREMHLAVSSGKTLKQLFYCKAIANEEYLDTLFEQETHVEKIEVTTLIYQKMAYRGSTEGVLGVFEFEETPLHTLNLPENPLILVAEAPEKPGNIGALLRTADAANLDAVLIANPKTDLYNPNIIRSSVGCVFTNTVITGTTQEIIEFLQKQEVQILCASLEASQDYHHVNFKNASAIVVGTEANGLSKHWLENSSQNIIIPMQGTIDSMNVSVAAGILIFEAKRQRNFK